MKKVKVLTNGTKQTFYKVISPKIGGGSVRKFYKQKSDAETYLEQQQILQKNYGTAALSFSDKLRADAQDAAEILDGTGKSLTDAARFLADHLKMESAGVPVKQAVAEFLATKEVKNPHNGTKKRTAQGRNYKSRSYHLTPFMEQFGKRTTGSIKTADIDAYIAGRGVANQTQKNFRQSLNALFEFAIGREWCKVNPVHRAMKPKVTPGVIGLLTPAETNRLLASCDTSILAAVVIGAFCGMRQAEIARLSWKKVDLQEKRITVDAEIAKTNGRRMVVIPDNAVKWLELVAMKEGMVMPAGFRRIFDHARVQAGFAPSFKKRNDAALKTLLDAAEEDRIKLTEWPDNCLRHSAISYRLAETGDIGKVATSAGNSQAVISKHYNGLAKPSVGKSYFQITPTIKRGKIIHLPRKAA